ncbi:NADPH:quinone reductase-like Zn-dependent oxidoreductase [Homoserinimonas aerilata]|uniref:NADPH:quinone reductase-like Zn-dependent oxidoreductase n=1 Tax=Homoserinimonas aerilata TaxID=1162970 RepID=A0A542YK17_9MICO|nr:NADP-dependent oxidoreductase [Homoserinimonas aerilata]TQL48412.1 NADPH:quinone reductase-like Zn-dependent oxidoreductase [Homoserinimonas aerilata]
MPQAVRYDEFGPRDVLYIAEEARTEPGTGEVSIAVQAVGLNPFDMKARMGVIPFADPGFPRGICSDFAGVVDAAGADARYFDGTAITIGDEVLGWGDGTLREQLLVTAGHIVKKPEGVPWEVAGSLTTPGLTAQASIDTLDIGAGDTVLVSAAAGAVGILYSQLAIARGATVVGTASERNHELLRSLGVIPVTYGDGLVERVRAAAPDGVTAAQDNFGRETIDAALALGLPPQRICGIVDHAATAELGLASPGRYVRSPATLLRLAEACRSGDLMLPVQKVFGLDGLDAAFELLEGRHLSGKVVIAMA